MEEGRISVYAGSGRGKSSAAIGLAMRRAALGRKAVIIQFLKDRGISESDYARRLEPELKFFRFEKSEERFEDMDEEKRQEEIVNIRNGLGFAKKVLSTGECSLLVLDEVLGILENGIATEDEILSVLELRGDTDIVLTGTKMNDRIGDAADEITFVTTTGR